MYEPFEQEPPIPYGWEKDARKGITPEERRKIRELTKLYDPDRPVSVQDRELAKKFGIVESTVKNLRLSKK